MNTKYSQYEYSSVRDQAMMQNSWQKDEITPRGAHHQLLHITYTQQIVTKGRKA